MQLYRLDQFIAAAARSRLWLTDAYFIGTRICSRNSAFVPLGLSINRRRKPSSSPVLNAA